MRLALAPTLLVSFAASATPASTPDETFAALERAWSAAYHRHDLLAIEQLLAEEFVGIDGRGVTSTRRDELEEAKARAPDAPSPAMEVVAEEISDVQARIYGQMAIATALNTATVRTQEGTSTVRYRRTTVWVRRAGRWQCVHFHASRIV